MGDGVEGIKGIRGLMFCGCGCVSWKIVRGGVDDELCFWIFVKRKIEG
ncbi:hypothetical protein [Bacillus thuringiensis]|nr:hypothetical protein [Bacillus thuringiensis]